MGRAAMLLVMGLGVAFGFIGINLRSSHAVLIETQAGYYKYSMARNIARAAIHRSLRYIDRNANIANYLPPTSGSFNGGTYTVDSRLIQDTLWMAIESEYADTSYRMRTKLLRSVKPFPEVTGAIGVRASPLDLKMSGGASVDGRNYESDGLTPDTSCPDKPGFAVMTPADSAEVVNESTNIYGDPKSEVDTTTSNPDDFIDEYVANADYIISIPGTYAGGTYGTALEPKITVINAGDDTNFSIKFTGGFNGWGILAIRGNVWFSGGIDYHGLVIVYGTNNIVNFTATGTPKIVGGLIVAGRAASLTLKGTGSSEGKVAYSCDALELAKNLNKLRYYGVVEWYE